MAAEGLATSDAQGMGAGDRGPARCTGSDDLRSLARPFTVIFLPLVRIFQRLRRAHTIVRLFAPKGAC